jgi:hypothetical protein
MEFMIFGIEDLASGLRGAEKIFPKMCGTGFFIKVQFRSGFQIKNETASAAATRRAERIKRLKKTQFTRAKLLIQG